MNTSVTKKTIIEWGLGTLSESAQVEMIDRIGRLLYQALLVRSLDILSEKEQEELDRLLDQDSTSPDDVFIYLSQKIPTFNILVKDEREKLKEDILMSVNL